MGDSNDEKTLARAGELPPNGTPDTTRRDALARSLCARICDDRRDAIELGATAHGSQLMACVAIVNTIRIHLGLDEVAEAPAVDLRLKHALVGGER